MFGRPTEFHLNTYRPIYANVFTFSELDFASLYEDRRTFFADETYKHI